MNVKKQSLSAVKKECKKIAIQLCYVSVLPNILDLIDQATTTNGVERVMKMARCMMPS